MIRSALLMLAACGISPMPKLASAHDACIRAVRCQTFSEYEYSACMSCLQSDGLMVSKLRHRFGDIPPLDQIDCDFLAYVCEDMTHVATRSKGKRKI